MERIDLASSLSRANVDYLDSSIALVSDIRSIHETATDAILMENYLAVIVLNGSAALCVGENEMSVQRGDVFVCRPSNILALLEDPRQPFVRVKGYAELLHVTPKYFSWVCKRLSGKTANEIICEEVVRQAKLMLRDNSLSIKQIAERLNFANQSHFGTFFRRHTGVSPCRFRMS